MIGQDSLLVRFKPTLQPGRCYNCHHSLGIRHAEVVKGADAHDLFCVYYCTRCACKEQAAIDGGSRISRIVRALRGKK